MFLHVYFCKSLEYPKGAFKYILEKERKKEMMERRWKNSEDFAYTLTCKIRKFGI